MFGRKKRLDGLGMTNFGIALMERRLKDIQYLLEDIRRNTCKHGSLTAEKMKTGDYIVNCLMCETCMILTKDQLKKRFPDSHVAFLKGEDLPKKKK